MPTGAIYQIGDFEFNTQSWTLRRPAGSEHKLNENEARLLIFMIENYGKEQKGANYTRRIMAAVWLDRGIKVDERSLRKSVQFLREAFTPDGDVYILTRPYRISEDIPCRLLREIESSAPSVIGAFEETSSDQPMSREGHDFALVVDGMIINSVAELLVRDPQTEGIREACRSSYRRALEDLAFATVYASRIITSKDFRASITQPDQPGQEVAARLGEICHQRPYPDDIGNGQLLKVEKTRVGIHADIQRFSACIEDGRHVQFFCDYMQREGTKHLGDDNTLFQEDLEPCRYKFDARAYYVDRPLQDSLGRAADVLVGFLPKHPPNSSDRYANNALREFASRNVLSLITIMWEAEMFAKRAKAWRMPHVLRALVTHRRFADAHKTEQQEILRDFVVEQALTAALLHRRTENRDKLVAELLNLRDDPPFKQIRHVLNQEHLLLIEPDAKREQNARRIYRRLKALMHKSPLQEDRVQLLHHATLRALPISSVGFTTNEYEFELYRVFPELKPYAKRRS